MEVKYKYVWPEENVTYDSEEELKNAHPESCNPGEHEWKSTFVIAVKHNARLKGNE